MAQQQQQQQQQRQQHSWGTASSLPPAAATAAAEAAGMANGVSNALPSSADVVSYYHPPISAVATTAVVNGQWSPHACVGEQL
jgi:hypothetical protein